MGRRWAVQVKLLKDADSFALAAGKRGLRFLPTPRRPPLGTNGPYPTANTFARAPSGAFFLSG
jgi:hypothetical protein